MKYNYEKVENMIFSINKNIQELSELCLEYNISDAYILMDVIENYYSIIGYLKEQNKSANLCGLHDKILEKIGE